MTDEEIKAAIAERLAPIEAGIRELEEDRVPALVDATIAPLASHLAEVQRNHPSTTVH